MGVVRATRFSHTKWATWAGSWVTFCGLGRLRVKKSRGLGLGMAAPGTRRSVPKVGGPRRRNTGALRGAPGGSTVNWPVSHHHASAPAVVPHGGEITSMHIYIYLSKVDGGEAIREAPPLL
jgi:hypothetical protein